MLKQKNAKNKTGDEKYIDCMHWFWFGFTTSSREHMHIMVLVHILYHLSAL